MDIVPDDIENRQQRIEMLMREAAHARRRIRENHLEPEQYRHLVTRVYECERAAEALQETT